MIRVVMFVATTCTLIITLSDSYRHGMLKYQEILTQGRLFTHLNEIPHFRWYYGKVEKYYYRSK